MVEPLGWDVVPEQENPRTANLKFGLVPLRLVVASKRAIAPDLNPAVADPGPVRRRLGEGRERLLRLATGTAPMSYTRVELVA